jgi:hypothetical protein
VGRTARITHRCTGAAVALLATCLVRRRCLDSRRPVNSNVRRLPPVEMTRHVISKSRNEDAHRSDGHLKAGFLFLPLCYLLMKRSSRFPNLTLRVVRSPRAFGHLTLCHPAALGGQMQKFG